MRRLMLIAFAVLMLVMPATAQSTTPLRVGLLSAVTSGTSQPVNVSPYRQVTFYVKASALLSAGTLIFEEADWNPQTDGIFSGTWSTIDTITLSTPFASNGGQYAYHVGGPGGAYSYGFVRCRIGTGVTGGTLTVVLRAN